MTPVSPGVPPAGNILRPQPAADSFNRIGFWVLLAYTVIVFSRIFDNFASLSGLHIPMISVLLMSVPVFFTGEILTTLGSKISIRWVAFTVWLLLATLTSVWRGGSVDMLQNYWVPSLFLFFAMAGLVKGVADCIRVLNMIALSMFVILFVVHTSGRVLFDRLMGGEGVLGNSNYLASQLLFGLPFCLLLIFRKPFSVMGILAAVAALDSLYIILSTGSRAGFFGVLVLGGILFLLVPPVKKLQLVLVGTVLGVGMLAIVPDQIWSRFSTSFQMDRNSAATMDELSAVESSLSRWQLLMQGVDMTLTNPLLGVGPGMFIVATSDEMAERGYVGFWKDSHNSYTQVSSEAGIPALLVFLSVLGVTLKTLFSLYRQGRHSKDKDLTLIALCIGLSLLTTMFTAMFSNIAYHLYFTTLSGLTVALARVSSHELAWARQPKATARAVPRVLAVQPQPPSWNPSTPPAVPSERYAFGRVRRKPNPQLQTRP